LAISAVGRSATAYPSDGEPSLICYRHELKQKQIGPLHVGQIHEV
jgi:hypothetical protein